MNTIIEVTTGEILDTITDWAKQHGVDTETPIFNAVMSKVSDAINQKDAATYQVQRVAYDMIRSATKVIEEAEGGFHPQTSWAQSTASKLNDAQRQFDGSVITIKQMAHLVSTLADPDMKRDCKRGITNIIFGGNPD